MTNFEKYKEVIFTHLKNYDVMPAIVNDRPAYCSLDICGKCDLKREFAGNSCYKNFVYWLYDEYVEIPRLTMRECNFCKAIKSGWITRDRSGELYYFNARPYKNADCNAWDIDLEGDCADLSVLGLESNFSFIKWEDEKPWSIEELLKLEVAD